MQGCNDRDWILCDDGEEGSGRRLRRTPSAFPMLDRVERETECVRKAGLGHLQALPYAFHIDLGGQIDFVAVFLSCQEGVHFIQSGHQVVEYFCHGLPTALLQKTITQALVARWVPLAKRYFDRLVTLVLVLRGGLWRESCNT